MLKKKNNQQTNQPENQGTRCLPYYSVPNLKYINI